MVDLSCLGSMEEKQTIYKKQDLLDHQVLNISCLYYPIGFDNNTAIDPLTD